MKKNYFLALGLLFSAFATQAQTQYVDGILVLNEGGHASVSYINAAGQVTNNIFQTANNVDELGSIAQGMATDGEVTLIMLNASDKIEVVDARTFESIKTIDEGIILPRYAVIHEGKAYVTCWGGDDEHIDEAYMAIIDMETYEIEDTVPLASGVEQIYEKDGKLYILHMGGFDINNIMSVYDIETGDVEEVTVGDSPSELVFYDDYAYVISQGMAWNEPPLLPSFRRVNLSSLQVEDIDVLDSSESYKFIARYEDTFYIKVSADVYTFDVETQTLSEDPIIETNITTFGGAYGMSIIGDKLYLADAKDYVSDGQVFVYSLDGVLEDTFNVGEIPNNIYPSASSATSSDKFGKEAIKLYPNPATNRVFLTAENNAQVRVFDMLGKELMSTTYQSQGIDISGLAAGTYMMHVQNNNQTQTIRFVKK